jgi:hypothetical protein
MSPESTTRKKGEGEYDRELIPLAENLIRTALGRVSQSEVVIMDDDEQSGNQVIYLACEKQNRRKILYKISQPIKPSEFYHMPIPSGKMDGGLTIEGFQTDRNKIAKQFGPIEIPRNIDYVVDLLIRFKLCPTEIATLQTDLSSGKEISPEQYEKLRSQQ